MSINIYVGNLSFKTDENDLRGLFENFGEVTSARIISDQFTGRSRGFGFVEMSNREEGLKAIQELDSKDFQGRNLKVNEARPKSEGGGNRRAGGGGGGGGGRNRW
jgi:RNA recognition motif-containing protein